MKYLALIILEEKFGIDKGNTMVFGDYYNDLSMFKTAHFSYAMKNAPEDVKVKANFIADSNNANGVYNVIYKYERIKKEYKKIKKEILPLAKWSTLCSLIFNI